MHVAIHDHKDRDPLKAEFILVDHPEKFICVDIREPDGQGVSLYTSRPDVLRGLSEKILEAAFGLEKAQGSTEAASFTKTDQPSPDGPDPLDSLFDIP